MYFLRGENVVFYAGEGQVEGGESPEVDTVEARFRGSKGKQEQTSVVLVRMKSIGDNEAKALELLHQIHDGRLDLPPMAYRGYRGWRIGTRSQAIHCLRRRLLLVAETWKREGRVGKLRLNPKDFALHLGRIRGTTTLAVMGASLLVIQRKGVDRLTHL